MDDVNHDHDLVIERGGDLFEEATATFDRCRRHRYLLTRRWSDAPPLTFCMLNPSTADAFATDPTAERCLRRARREGAGGLVIVNLFALRATDPTTLASADDRIGLHGDAFLNWHLATATGPVIVAWGAHGALGGRGREVLHLLRAAAVVPLCLGVTKVGHPRHPLYVKADTELAPYRTQF